MEAFSPEAGLAGPAFRHRSWRRLPLGAILFLAALPLFLLGTCISLGELRRQHEHERSARAATLAASLARNLASSSEDLKNFNNVHLLRMVEYAARDLGIGYAMVVDREGRIVGHTDTRFIGTRVVDGLGLEVAILGQPLGPLARGGGGRNEILEFANPVFGEAGPVAAVLVGLERGAAEIGLADLRPFLLPAAGMFLMIPLAFAVVRVSLRPLRETGEELRAILATHGAPGLPVPPVPGLGMMASGFRDLARQLAKVFQTQEENRRNLEVEARVSEFERHRLELILERLPVGIVLEGPDGQVDLLNRAAENLTGLARESVGASGLEGFHLPGPSTTPGDERPLGDREGIQVSSTALYNGRQNLLGTLHVIRDLTAQRLVEQAQHEFVGHLAHEVKSPLNTIRSYTELLQDGEVDDREIRKEFFNTINEETDRLARLVENLLSLSRIEIGRLRLERQFIKTDNLIERAVGAVVAAARNKNQELRPELPDRLGHLSGDRQLLEVVLVNVLGNAVKYTPEGGRVALAAEETPERLIIRITDTGPGIPPEDKPRLFDKFFRSSSPEVASQPGHGLGLPLAREILGLHGGNISVTSTLGSGSTFTIELPLENDGGHAAVREEAAPSTAALVTTEA